MDTHCERLARTVKKSGTSIRAPSPHGKVVDIHTVCQPHGAVRGYSFRRHSPTVRQVVIHPDRPARTVGHSLQAPTSRWKSTPGAEPAQKKKVRKRRWTFIPSAEPEWFGVRKFILNANTIAERTPSQTVRSVDIHCDHTARQEMQVNIDSERTALTKKKKTPPNDQPAR